jgi:hypothetical protein
LGRKNKTYFFLKSTYFEAGTVINYIETYNTNTMTDLFNPTAEKDSIVQDDNGSISMRRVSFSKTITQNKRNLRFKEILDKNGGLPAKDECLMIKSNGCSDTGSIFQYMIDQGTCKALYLSTWIISRTNIGYICKHIDNGNIVNLTFIISVRMKQMSGGSGRATFNHLIEEFQKRDQVNLKVCNCHAKTFSAQIDDNYYTVTGSGNWTKNPRIENYTVTNDKDIFYFNKDWMSELL